VGARTGEQVCQRQGKLLGKLIKGLLEYAEQLFKFEQPVGEGTGAAPLSAHYRQAAKQLGLPVDTWQPKGVVPVLLQFAWELFLDLSATRTGTGFGPNPITYEAMLAWCALYGERLTPLEIGVVRKLDSVWLKVQHARHSGTKPNHTK
jgi:hypothetical protein